MIDDIRRRDPMTLETVAREHVAPLLRAARAAGLSEADARDVVQEALLVFVQKADTYDGRASVRTWLFGILFNKISERRRAAARQEASDDIEAIVNARFDARGQWIKPPRAPDAELAAGEAMKMLRECLDQLPERRRAAFVLREVEQLELDEVCKALQVTRNNLGVLLFRARNALRECLESKGIEGSSDAAL